MKTSLLSHTKAALREKLRQHRLTGALTRSKVITKSATPVMDAIAAEAKLRGVSCDDLVGDWVAGKVKLTALDSLVSPTAAASHGLAIAATAAKPSTPSPAPVRGILEQFQAICKHGDLSARVAFFNKHSAALKRASAASISNQ